MGDVPMCGRKNKHSRRAWMLPRKFRRHINQQSPFTDYRLCEQCACKTDTGKDQQVALAGVDEMQLLGFYTIGVYT